MILEKTVIRSSLDIDLTNTSLLEWDANICIKEIIQIRNDNGKPKGIFKITVQFECPEI